VTPLQAYIAALGDLVRDARDELDAEAYSWLIAVGCELFGTEAARLFAGEVLRATREKGEAA
jgi:hypothetical protein